MDLVRQKLLPLSQADEIDLAITHLPQGKVRLK